MNWQLVINKLLLEVGIDVEFVVELLIWIRLLTDIVVVSVVVTGLPTITGDIFVVDSVDMVGVIAVGVGITCSTGGCIVGTVYETKLVVVGNVVVSIATRVVDIHIVPVSKGSRRFWIIGGRSRS